MTNQLQKQEEKTFSLRPTSFVEAMQFAKMFASSNLVPTALKGKPEEVFLTIQMGYEIGLTPFAAIQNISVINGKTSLWGDAMLAIVKAHPAFEYLEEKLIGSTMEDRGYQCTIKRKGEPAHTVIFTIADAKAAGLWGKAGPWTQYPKRMLQMRCRGFALRDAFPDALKGIISREEAQDYEVVGNASTIKSAAPNPKVIEHEIEEDSKWMDVDPKTGEILEDKEEDLL